MNTTQINAPQEDRNSIRNLVDQYAYCADSRDAQGQMSLFTEDTIFEVYYDVKSKTPTQTVLGRANLFPVFEIVTLVWFAKFPLPTGILPDPSGCT